MTRFLLSPQAFLIALVLLGVVLGVSCWPDPRPETVTPTVAPPSPTVYVFWPSVTPTPRPDIFIVPPTPKPEVILDRTALPSSTPTPTPVAPTSTPEPTPTPDKPAVQRG